MPQQYDVIPYQPDLKQQVLKLQTSLWSPSVELNRAYFDWKHERNPYVRPSLMYLALHRGNVVGMRSFFGMQWEAGSPRQTLMGLYADDMVIAPDHRNRGLMRLIMEAAFKDLSRLGYEYVFNLSAGPKTFASSLAMGWHSPGSMQPLRWRSWHLAGKMAMRRITKRFPALSGQFLAEIDPSQVKSASVSFAFQPQPAAMAELVDRLGSDGRIRHVRDRAFFEWRFQNPLSRYGFLFCGEGRLDGYLVLREYTSPSADREPLHIVDWEAATPEVLARLVQAACSVAGSRKPLFVWSATESPERTAVLAQRGFRSVKENWTAGLLVRAVAGNRGATDWSFAGRRMANLAEWDLRTLYSMHG